MTQLSRYVSPTVRGHSRRIRPFLVRLRFPEQTWAVAPELSATALLWPAVRRFAEL